jgi:hypothetical protein
MSCPVEPPLDSSVREIVPKRPMSQIFANFPTLRNGRSRRRFRCWRVCARRNRRGDRGA